MLVENQELKMRTCTQCGEEKQLIEENFYKEETAKEGHRTKCKECTKSKYKQTGDFSICTWYESRSKLFKGKWTFEDIKWIYDNYLKIGRKELIEKFPDSNYKTLTNIIYQWDIKKIEKNDNWSEEEIEFLKINYPSMAQNQLQEKLLNRTWYSIKGKASKLGVCRNDEMLFKINSDAHKGYVMPEAQRRKIGINKRGSNSPSWKGGLTPLHTYFRSILNEWKNASFKVYNYKCAFTNTNNGDLQIHHSNENFSDIIVETLNILNLPIYKDMLLYSDEERININNTFLELNYRYGLGIPLTKQLHKLFHVLYGLTNNTQEQFEEFKQRYINGEFNNTIEIENNVPKEKRNNKNKTRKNLVLEEVIKIKQLLIKGFSISYIAKEFGCSDTSIYNIKTLRSWSNVSLEEVS